MSDFYLKTQQVADALQIGVSTVKRWVDKGILPATKTEGKHRLVRFEDARDYALSKAYPTDLLDRIFEEHHSSTVRADSAVCSDLVEALVEGRSAYARQIISATHARLGSAAALADELIHPVLEKVGHGWSVGRWDIYQEHQASQALVGAITHLLSKSRRPDPSTTRLALGTTPPQDLYTIPLLLAELTLRELGWTVRNLGPNLPLASLTKAVRNYRPALVFLSMSHLGDPASFLQDFPDFRAAARSVDAEVIVGGRALSPELREKLPHTIFGDKMADLADLGRQLLPVDQPSPSSPLPTLRVR